MTTFDETLDNMEKDFVGLTHEEKFALGCERGYFDRIESEVDNKLIELETEHIKTMESLERMKKSIENLIKLKLDKRVSDTNDKKKKQNKD